MLQVNTRIMPSDQVSFRKIIQYNVPHSVIQPDCWLFLVIVFTVSRMAEISAGIPGGDRQRVEAASSKSEVNISNDKEIFL